MKAGSDTDKKSRLTFSFTFSTHAADAILEEAERASDTAGYDLIAMATHGRSGLKQLVMGSVAQYVLAESKHALLLCGHRICSPQATLAAIGASPVSASGEATFELSEVGKTTRGISESVQAAYRMTTGTAFHSLRRSIPVDGGKQCMAGHCVLR